MPVTIRLRETKREVEMRFVDYILKEDGEIQTILSMRGPADNPITLAILLQDDLVHAGYWGGYVPQFDNLSFSGVPGDAPTAVPPFCRSSFDRKKMPEEEAVCTSHGEPLPKRAQAMMMLACRRAFAAAHATRHRQRLCR